MDAPQSPAEIAPVVAALRAIDARFDIVWNPRAVILRHGGYDANGKLTASVYDGRWEVILYDNGASRTTEIRDYQRVCLVTPAVPIGHGLLALDQDGGYAPVGEWLVRFLEQVDYHNRTSVSALSAQLEARNVAREASDARTTDDGHRDVLDAMHFAGTMEGGVSQFHPVRLALTPAET